METPQPRDAPAEGNFWAITSYFNPAGYVRRRANYRRFREHLVVPLVTVELSFDGHFELAPGDAEILVQITGGDVMWQKERLLNLAIDALPPECIKVLSVDCDVIFQDASWLEKTAGLLEQFPLVQAFSRLNHMPPDWTPDSRSAEPLHTRPSAVLLARERSLAEALAGIRIAYGFAWAASRQLYRDCRFYDGCVIGGADLATVCAAYQKLDVAQRYHHMEARRRHDHFRSWAEPFADAVGGNVGYVDGTLHHLWHGTLEDRQYVERVDGLARFAFDPYTDLAIDGAGAWRWNSDKPAMHAYVRDYFSLRREDG